MKTFNSHFFSHQFLSFIFVHHIFHNYFWLQYSYSTSVDDEDLPFSQVEQDLYKSHRLVM